VTHTPERVDLFGNPVAPTVQQGSLFAPHVGAPAPKMPGAITAEEMTARRDELGAPAAPIAGVTPLDWLDALTTPAGADEPEPAREPMTYTEPTPAERRAEQLVDDETARAFGWHRWPAF